MKELSMILNEDNKVILPEALMPEQLKMGPLETQIAMIAISQIPFENKIDADECVYVVSVPNLAAFLKMDCQTLKAGLQQACEALLRAVTVHEANGNHRTFPLISFICIKNEKIYIQLSEPFKTYLKKPGDEKAEFELKGLLNGCRI